MTKSIGTGWLVAFWSWFRQKWRLFIIGNSAPDARKSSQLLPYYLALPLIAASLISSLTYVIDEMLLAFADSVPVSAGHSIEAIPLISVAIVLLMLLVGYSCWSIIKRFQSNDGYIFVRDILGTNSGLIAAIALAIAYMLTVAVSISAAVNILIATLPLLHRIAVPLALGLVALLTLFNIRAVRNVGWVLMLPSYSFVAIIVLLIIKSLFTSLQGGVSLATPLLAEMDALHPFSAFGILVILQAFAYGSIAVAGVESFINADKSLQAGDKKKTARRLILVLIAMALLFFGLAYAATLAQLTPVVPKLPVITQLARLNFGNGFLYYFTAAAAVAVLLLAAHVSFAAAPRLAAVVARDGFLPKSLSRKGDPLVYARGIFALGIAASLLLAFFRVNLHSLIGLYAVGIFLLLTLMQLAVCKEAFLRREQGWQLALLAGIMGSFMTALVTLIIAFRKFEAGTWVVLLLIPLLLLIIRLIKAHYDWFDAHMLVSENDANPLSIEKESMTVIVLLSSDIHRGILEGLECGRSIVAGQQDATFRAVHVEVDPERSQRLRNKWTQFVAPHLGDSVQLDIIPSPYRWLTAPVIDYLDETMKQRPEDRIIVILPEFETGSRLTQFLHNFTAGRLRSALLSRPRVTLVSSRFFMKPMAWRQGRGGLVY